MQIDWEFARNGLVILTGSSFIPMGEGVPMTTSVMAVPVTAAKAAPAAVANQGRFAFLLTTKDALLAKGAQANTALLRLADKAHLGGAVRWVQTAFGWALRKLTWIPRTLGVSGMLGLGTGLVTTQFGQNIIKTVAKAAIKPFTWLTSRVYGLLGWTLRLLGKPGNAVADKMDDVVYGTIDAVVRHTAPVRRWFGKVLNPENRGMKWLATAGRALTVQAIIASLIPGGWVYLAYILAAPLVFKSLRPSSIKKAWNEAKAQAELAGNIAEAAQPVPVDINAYKAEMAAKGVEVTTHPNSDGSVSIVTHVTDEQMLADGMVPSGEVQVLEDGTEVKVYEPITEVLDTPVLSTNATKAERRRQAEAARKENDRLQREAAAARRAEVAEKAAARRQATQDKADALAKGSPVFVTP